MQHVQAEAAVCCAPWLLLAAGSAAGVTSWSQHLPPTRARTARREGAALDTPHPGSQQKQAPGGYTEQRGVRAAPLGVGSAPAAAPAALLLPRPHVVRGLSDARAHAAVAVLVRLLLPRAVADKQQLLWVEAFNTVEDLRLALHAFRRRNNASCLV